MMPKLLPAAFVTSGLIILSGCNSMRTDVPEESVVKSVVPSKQHEIKKDPTITWNNKVLAGAAYREESYTHVLAKRSYKSLNDSQPQVLEVAGGEENNNPYSPEQIVQTLNQIEADKSSDRFYSHYEMSRWERFCNNGQGMDEKDWLFVSGENGRKNIPSLLVESCNPPAYTYKEYQTAWEKHCQNLVMSEADKIIVQNSFVAKSVCSTEQQLKLTSE